MSLSQNKKIGSGMRSTRIFCLGMTKDTKALSLERASNPFWDVPTKQRSLCRRSAYVDDSERFFFLFFVFLSIENCTNNDICTKNVNIHTAKTLLPTQKGTNHFLFLTIFFSSPHFSIFETPMLFWICSCWHGNAAPLYL